MKLTHDPKRLRRITDPKEFGKVAVLFGGGSAEREISLISGRAVLAALKRRGIDATGVDPREEPLTSLIERGFDRAFIVLHGPGGEDGTAQGALEFLGLPYTGSGVMGSALAMDKLRTKRLWLGAGLPTPDFRILRQDSDWNAIVTELGLPLMVKPAREGSSIGISKVDAVDDLPEAYGRAKALDPLVIAERYIKGGEYTAPLLGGQALPLIKLETPRAFYDHQAKYFDDQTRYVCPCGLAPEVERRVQQLALEAFETIGGSGWGRIDLMLDEQQRPWFIEANTVPGMTSHSLVPMAAQAVGIGFGALVRRILDTSFSASGDGA